MKTIWTTVLLLAAAPAWAQEDPFAQPRRYGSQGTLEISGSLALTSTASVFETSVGELAGTLMDVELKPTVGYFVIDGLAVELSPFLGYQKTDVEDSPETSSVSLGAVLGVGYYFELGPVRLGPEAFAGYASTVYDDGTEAKGSGPTFGGGAALKLPIGTGGLVDLSAGYRFESDDATNFADSISTNGLAVSAGLGIFF
jgi:hypothetical protein